MATTSKIEWTEQTWNPITGCTKVSPGCKHCYAETMSCRLQAMGARGYAVTVHSMSDLFHEDVSFDYIDRVFATIEATPQHTYQILTKRASRMAEYCKGHQVPVNAWLGVSVEDRKYGKPRIGIFAGNSGKNGFYPLSHC